VQKAVTPLLTLGGKPIQISGNCTEYWALRWQRHSETTAISILCSKQAAGLFLPMVKCR